MKFKFSAAILVVALLVFTQCKKDSGTTTNPTTTKDYLPETSGSSFDYKFTDSTGTTTFTSTSTGRDTTFSGNTKTYRIFKVNDSTYGFYARNGKEYYTLTTLPLVGEYDELYLKDSANINDSWSKVLPAFSGSSIPGSPISGNITPTVTYTIADKPASLLVESKTYTDLVKVRMNITAAASVSGFPVALNIGYRESYYARGVGLVKEDYNISVKNPITSAVIYSYTSSQVLTNYVVK